jgi:hypothetical protein
VTPSAVVEAIVSSELAAQVRAILSDPSRRTSPGQKVRHLASGIAVCGACGSNMLFMRDYRCKASAAHPCIRKDRLDARIRAEVARAFLAGGPNLFPPTRSGVDVVAKIAQHERNLAEVREVTSDRAEGLIPSAVARTRLIELRTAREQIEAELEQARAEKGAASALAHLAQGLLVGDEWTMHEWAEKVEAVSQRFDALDLDAQRELVRALLYVEVGLGRDTGRVRIRHLRATHLNPDEVDLLSLGLLDEVR